jgi:hypothetical protein
MAGGDLVAPRQSALAVRAHDKSKAVRGVVRVRKRYRCILKARRSPWRHRAQRLGETLKSRGVQPGKRPSAGIIPASHSPFASMSGTCCRMDAFRCRACWRFIAVRRRLSSE